MAPKKMNFQATVWCEGGWFVVQYLDVGVANRENITSVLASWVNLRAASKCTASG
jgi:hypothetical protein